jgi:small subunit ribosomal protein S1
VVDETFEDEGEGEESFAELLEQNLKQKRRRVSPGEKVTGTIVQVGAEHALLDLGGGLDGIISIGELVEPGQAGTLKPGQKVEGYVVRVEDRIAELAKSLGKGPAARFALEEAAQSGVPVEGHVEAVNKGGYVVMVAGTRCFCPLGQMDVRRIEDPATLIGQKLQFRVAEFRGGRDVVLSRRALLEEEMARRAEETRKRLEPGARFRGTVTSVREFGAFVDIGGIEGLVHASELGWGRMRPDEVVRIGQEVEVEVLKIEAPKDGKGERLSLSMRALAQDPFDLAVTDLPEGTIARGTVTRLQPFGAFVELIPGVEGLIHVSAFGRRVGHPSDAVAVGQEIAVRVEGVDPTQRRISLSYVSDDELDALGFAHDGIEAPPPPTVVPVPAKPGKGAAAAAKEGPGLSRRPGKPAPEAASPEKVVVSPAVIPTPVTEKAPLGSSVPKPRILGRAEPRQTEPAFVAHEGAPATPTPAGAAGMATPPVGAVLDVTVDRVEPFGVFVTWPGGRGLVPGIELGTPRGADLRRSHPPGTVFRAAVVDVRPDGKVRLSKVQAERAEERAEADAWQRTQVKPSGKGFGTFADLLKGKLGK